jgi:hypothetical protein
MGSSTGSAKRTEQIILDAMRQTHSHMPVILLSSHHTHQASAQQHTSVVPHKKTKLDEESQVPEWQDEVWSPHLIRKPAEQCLHS